jgi:hypothetical protein
MIIMIFLTQFTHEMCVDCRGHHELSPGTKGLSCVQYYLRSIIMQIEGAIAVHFVSHRVPAVSKLKSYENFFIDD